METRIARGVRFVVIGAIAANYQGAQETTEDVDVTPDRESRNLMRLCEALDELDAVVIDDEGNEHPEARINDQNLRIWEVTHLRTRHGQIDIVINPAAANGYPDLVRHSRRRTLPSGETVQIAALSRVIESKRACDRTKNRATIPRLERVLNEKGDG